AVILARGGCSNRRNIRSGVRLCDSETTDELTAQQRRDPFFLLLLTAELQERQRRAHLHVDRHTNGAVNPRDFLRNEHHGEKAEAVSAVFFRNDTAEESQF